MTAAIFFVAMAWATNKVLDRYPNALEFLQAVFLEDLAMDKGVNAQILTLTNLDEAAAVTNSGEAAAVTNSGEAAVVTNSGEAAAATNSDESTAVTNSGESAEATNSVESTAVENPDEHWINRIREGGLILHFRHWQRDKSMDPAMFDSWEINNGLNARDEFFGFSTCLLDRGIAEGKMVNLLFKHAGIKVAKVISSPSCRAIESAEYGFGRVDEVWRSLLGASSMPPRRWKSHGKDLHNRLMNIEIPSGSNVVLTGHKSTFSHNSEILFAEPPTVDVDDRNQGGLLIIERTKKGLVARHVYKRIYNYAVQLTDYTVN